MAARGSRIAKHRPPARDKDGRSFPSDTFAHYIALELVCSRCKEHGNHVVLAGWAIDSRLKRFDPDQIFERGDNRALTHQELPDGHGGVRSRYSLLCPACGNAPQFRQEKVDAALRAVWAPGVQNKVAFCPV